MIQINLYKFKQQPIFQINQFDIHTYTEIYHTFIKNHLINRQYNENYLIIKILTQQNSNQLTNILSHSLQIQISILWNVNILYIAESKLHPFYILNSHQSMSGITEKWFHQNFIEKHKIGRGNCANVYRIIDRHTNEQFALKKIKLNKLGQCGPIYNQLELERALNINGIPKIYYHFIKSQKSESYQKGQDAYICLIMELCQSSLENEIQERRQRKEMFKMDQLWHFMRQSIRIFSAMQRKNAIHRDIKPGNILIKSKSEYPVQYRICDLGYATFNNKYAVQTITGTRQYVSPRIMKKFIHTSINIAAITAKDDIYSLGKTILQMICLNNINNENINKRLFQNLERTINGQFLFILNKMLQFEEANRWDFIKVQERLKMMQKPMLPHIIDLCEDDQKQQVMTSHTKNMPTNNKLNYQNPQKNNQSQKQPLQFQSIQVQTEDKQLCTVEKCSISSQIQISSLMKQYSFLKKNLMVQQGDTVYIGQQNQNKKLVNLIGQQMQNKKLANLLCLNCFKYDQQIYCVTKIGNFILLGLQNNIGIIRLPSQQNSLFIMKLNHQRFTKTRIFIIQKFLQVKDRIFFIATCGILLHCSKLQLLNELIKITKFKQQSIKQKILKRIAKVNIFGAAHKEFNNNQPIIYEFESSVLEGFDVLSPVNCVAFIQNSIFGSQAVLIGGVDGSLKMLNDPVITLQMDEKSQPIYMIKMHDHSLIYSTNTGRIIRLKIGAQGELVRNTYKNTVPIIHFDVNQGYFSSNLLEHQRAITPYLNCYTYDGKLLQLNYQMKLIAHSCFHNDELIQFFSSNFVWNITKDNDGQQFINLSQQKQKIVYFVDIKGKLIEAKSKNIIYDFNIEQVSSAYVSQRFIIVTNFDGEVKMLLGIPQINKMHQEDLKRKEQPYINPLKASNSKHDKNIQKEVIKTIQKDDLSNSRYSAVMKSGEPKSRFMKNYEMKAIQTSSRLKQEIGSIKKSKLY